MTLEEFKRIYYMEWLHRQLGRLLGLVFIGPAAYFYLRRRLHGKDRVLVPIGAALIGFQGALGWYMVKSGLDQKLIDEHGSVPRVSPYRLAAHLGTAFVLYAGMLRRGLEILRYSQPLDILNQRIPPRFKMVTSAVTGLVFLTALSGEVFPTPLVCCED
jgi:heme a synthase